MEQTEETVVVTRHSALVAYLIEAGFLKQGTNVIPHASEALLKGKHVIGNIPLNLAAAAKSVTVVPMNLPFEARGRELTLEEVRKYAQTPRTYIVQEV